jgi:outer membrane protein
MNVLVEKITKAIKEVGAAGGYLYIFDTSSGIPYISETLSTDVTAAVKTKLGIQ